MLITPSFTQPVPLAEAPTSARARAVARPAPPALALPISLLGVAFDPVTKAEAVTDIAAMIATRRPHYVVTANVDFLVQAQTDVELRRILLEADLVLCDGTPLLWASRWLANPLPERTAGADVVPLLIQAAADQGHRVFLLGAAPGVATEAAAQLQRQHPALVIAGHHSPPFGSLLEIDTAEIVRRVQAAQPDILLVSFGCPKQEKWIAMHHRRLGVPVVIGVGATLDFIAGRMRRAPAWMQRTGTECLFRLAQEPRRLARRYFGDLVHFVPAIAGQRWHLRTPARPTKSLALGRSPDGCFTVTGDFSAAALRDERNFPTEPPPGTDPCRLDLSQVDFLDSTGVAVLLRWRHRLQNQGRRLTLLNPSPAASRTLRRLQLTGHFWIELEPAGIAPATEDPGTRPPVIPPYPGGHTLAWEGEVTAANAAIVWDLTRQHLAAVGPPPNRTFIIDLSGLRFIDSAGAELMSRLRLWAAGLKNELRFLEPRPAVCNVLHLARLGTLLEKTRP